jgi:hypothetical protein
MMDIATLKRWPPTSLWPHEALSFNPWLADHLDVLDDVLHAGWTFTEGKVQQEAGSLWVDVVATTSDGGRACIEAQFGTSNHDHLGKLLTYIAAYDAKAAVWIVGEPRPEHVQAVTALNRGFHDVDFFMVRLEVVSVGESGPKAPLFSLIAGPSPTIKTAGEVMEELAGNTKLIMRFWMDLLPVAAKVVPGFVGKKPRPVRRLGTAAGRRGIRFQFGTRQHASECGLTIFGGKHGDAGLVLDELAAHRAEIEGAFGSPLEWVSGSRCRIRTTMSGGYLDEADWPALHPKLAETLGRLAEALKPYLDSLTSRPATAGIGADEQAEEGEDEDEGG